MCSYNAIHVVWLVGIYHLLGNPASIGGLLTQLDDLALQYLLALSRYLPFFSHSALVLLVLLLPKSTLVHECLSEVIFLS